MGQIVTKNKYKCDNCDQSGIESNVVGWFKLTVHGNTEKDYYFCCWKCLLVGLSLITPMISHGVRNATTVTIGIWTAENC